MPRNDPSLAKSTSIQPRMGLGTYPFEGPDGDSESKKHLRVRNHLTALRSAVVVELDRTQHAHFSFLPLCLIFATILSSHSKFNDTRCIYDQTFASNLCLRFARAPHAPNQCTVIVVAYQRRKPCRAADATADGWDCNMKLNCPSGNKT